VTFVGRDRELAQLAAGVEDALGGEGRLFLIAGEPGIGKTRLAEQVGVYAAERGAGADDPSLLLLRYLARDLRGAHLLTIGTYRDLGIGHLSDAAGSLGELLRDGHPIALRGLARDDAQALIGDLAGSVPSAATVLAVHEATEGNPLFIRETVRLLDAAGTLDRPGRPDVPIPGSVRTLMQQRLAPLPADAVAVLAAAAVVGRDFDLALVGPACGLPAERVLGATSEVVALGIVVAEAGAPERYRFAHSLMREVIYESLPIPVRVGLHRAVGAAIEHLAGPDSDARVAELARHFSEIAGDGESARALAYTRRAGDRAMQAHAYEEAVVEYRRSLRALELDGPDDDMGCELLLRLGEALVRAGRYMDAKEVHLQAAEVARRLRAPDRLARAALGFGEPQVEGGLVNRQLVALLRETLDALSPDDSPLRARLLARLSVELTFSEEVHLTDGLSRQATEMARRLGDVRSLGDALDARWMAIWGPDGLSERAGLADEILALAEASGDRELELLGRAQRAATALESGDMLAAEADIATYARHADELRMPVHQWAATSMRAMRALLQGTFEDAETLAEAALALQPERPNARWAHINERAILRWEQGRVGEIRETWAPLVDRFPRAAFARGWLALADTERGDDDSARRALRLLAEQLPERPRSGLWLPGIAVASLVAAALDDAEAAGRLHAALLPYAGHVIAMNMEHPVACFGSASLHLALLATTASRWDEAVGHFEATIRMHERLGAAPLLARTRYEYARMLARRGQPADRAQTLDLLERAATTARALGMAGVCAQIATLLDAHVGEESGGAADAAVVSASAVNASAVNASAAAGAPPDHPAGQESAEAAPAGAPPAASTPAGAASTTGRSVQLGDGHPSEGRESSGRERFHREGEYWTIAYDGAVVRLKDSKGLRQIALLLAHPGQELHATDLEARVSGPSEPKAQRVAVSAEYGELGVRADGGDAGELLDAEAKAAYKVRLDELQAEIDEAENFNDPARAEQARDERTFLVRELARAVGIGGRDRRAASHAERARLNATRAIRAAMSHLGREHPSLGRHLAATIRTGRYCSYTPDPRTPVSWEL